MGENAKGHLLKIAETSHRVSSMEAAYSEHSISMAGYFESPELAFVCIKLPGREASSFCDFFNLTSCDFTAFFSFLTPANLWLFLDVLNPKRAGLFCLSQVRGGADSAPPPLRSQPRSDKKF